MKVGVIGIDGFDFEYGNKILDQLPNIKKFSFDGELHKVQTHLPAMSASVWTTYTTGVNPGQHGIFDFFKTGSVTKLQTSHDVKVPRIWDVLSNMGKRCLVINVPLTYPPTPLRGAMVSGVMSKHNDGDTYPAGFKKHIQPYEVESSIDFEHELGEEILEKIVNNFEMRICSLLKCFGRNDYDFFFIVLNVLDRGSHYYFGDDEILMLYKLVDDVVGTLSEFFVDWKLMCISDHGFREIKQYFRIEQWLKDKQITNVIVEKPVLPNVVTETIKKLGKYVPKNRELQRKMFHRFFQPRSYYQPNSPVTFYSNASRYVLCDPSKTNQILETLRTCPYISYAINAKSHFEGKYLDERMIFLVGEDGIEVVRGFGEVLVPNDALSFFASKGAHRLGGTVFANFENLPKHDVDVYNTTMREMCVEEENI